MVIEAVRDLVITFFDWRALRNSQSDAILRQKAGEQLSPADPSANYHIMRDTHHKGTAAWFIESSTFTDCGCYCGSTESVCSLALYVFGTIADFRFRSGLRQKRPYVCHPITLVSASVPSIIDYHELYGYPRYRTLLQHRANTLGLFFSIRGHRKTGCPCFPLFYPRSAQQPISPIPLYPSRIFYSAHQRGSQQPNERRELTRCIEKMLNDPRE
jgi:hypothetical protein